MAKVIEKSAKTVEDALKAALEELGVSESEVDYEIVEEASKGFLGLIGSKPAKVRVTLKEENESEEVNQEMNQELNDNDNVDVKEKSTDEEVIITEEKVEVARKFLQDVLRDMKLEVKTEERASEGEYIFNICGENLGILIGKHGQTLDALQYLVNLAANRNENNRIHYVVDVENYRIRRAETLQSLAKNLAERAVRMNQAVKLEPMNRYERKIIHMTLQDNEEVTTYSKGEEPYRYIVITPKK